MQTYMKPGTQQAVTALHTCRALGCRRGCGLPGRAGLPRQAAGQRQLGTHCRGLPSLAFISTSKDSLCKKEMQIPYWSSTGRHDKKKKPKPKDLWRASHAVWGCWSYQSAIIPVSFLIVTFPKQLFCFENKPERARVWPRKVYPVTNRIPFYMQIRKPFSTQVVKDNTAHRAHATY